MTDPANSSGFDGLTLVLALLLSAGCGGYVAYWWRRRRIYATGVRGTALVIKVEKTPWAVRYNHLAPATETVTIATHHRPRGVPQERIPPGQYEVGQVVPVIQPAGRPELVRLDRPDLEETPRLVWGFTAMAVLAPLLALRTLLGW